MAKEPKEGALGGEAKPNPPMLAAAVPSPNTLLAEDPMGLLKEGLEPKDAAPPNAGELPKEGGLPKTGALPKPLGFAGEEKEPKPWDATLPPPVLKVPAGFCSPKEDCPKLNDLAPLLPNRLLVPVCVDCPNPPVEAVAPKGFLLLASSVGLPPRPPKNPPPVEEPAVLAELEPNRPPPDDGCCPNTLPLLGCWPNSEEVEEEPKAEGCPKLNPVDEDVVVLLPNTDP